MNIEDNYIIFIYIYINIMESSSLDYLSHYEKIIESHHHDLEGIYLGFIDKELKKIKYTELIPISNINLKINDDESKKKPKLLFDKKKDLSINLNLDESRYFDLMTATIEDFKKQYDTTYTLQIKDMLENDITYIKEYLKETENKLHLKKSDKPNLQETDPHNSQETDPHKSQETDTPNTTVDKINSIEYNRSIISSLHGGEHHPYDNSLIFIYKYIDPVIRMCCEYMILFDRFIKKNSNYLKLFIDEKTGKIDESKITCWLGFVWEENKGVPPEGTEGSICVFGVGKIDCCSNTLKNENLNTLSIKHELFHLERYNQIIKMHTYNNYPFNNPKTLGLKSAENYLKINDDKDKILSIKIMQIIINKIIEKSGRAEGAKVGGQTKPYPNIHLLEVLDPENKIWILRSERFHISKSPCVHNGLKNITTNDHFLKYLGLWKRREQLEFPAVSLLHTIGHALDRLYCGHKGHALLQLDTNYIFNYMKYCFKYLMELKVLQGDKPIFGFIPLDITNNNYVDLFYYICMSDFVSIENKLKKMDLPKLQTLYLNLNSEQNNDKQQIVQYLLKTIKEKFNKGLLSFPLYDINNYYTYDGTTNQYKYIKGCEIKEKYGCPAKFLKTETDFLREMPE